MTTATTDLPTLLTAITALENAARYDDALALVDATQVADDRDRLGLLMARASVVGRRDYTRGARSAGDHPLDAAQELAAGIGTGPTVAWDLAMQHLRRQYADQLVDGIGPAGRDEAVVDAMTVEAAGCATLRPTTAAAAGPACAWAGSPTICAGTGSRRHATTPRRWRPAGPWPTRCSSSRRSGTWATTLMTMATTRGRWRPGRSPLPLRPGRARARRPGPAVLLGVLARDAGDEAGAQALAAETLRWAEQLGATRLSDQVTGFLAGVDPTAPPQGAAANR